MTTIYRIQDKEGRGPFRPGMTKHWSDPYNGQPSPKALHEDFSLDVLDDALVFAKKNGLNLGCGCRSLHGLRSYFTPTERAKLAFLGYKEVTIDGALIILESESQVVFGCPVPLADVAKPLR